MARPLRLEIAGGLYHVTSRGNRREVIYENDEDRSLWLETLSRVCTRYNWRVHAYCLMDNHYHMVIETAEGNLSKGMRQLNGVYTQIFNRRHSRVGHVFQGRYKAILVEKEAYLLELSRYVVLNPLRAHLANNLEDWLWSSYLATTGKCGAPDWLEVDWLLSHFGKQRKRAREKYIDFVKAGIDVPSIWDNLQNQIYLGNENFVNKQQKAIKHTDRLEDVPALQKRAIPKPLDYYQKKYHNRNQAIAQAFLSGGYTMKQIGDYFGRHYTTVSRIVKQYEML